MREEQHSEFFFFFIFERVFVPTGGLRERKNDTYKYVPVSLVPLSPGASARASPTSATRGLPDASRSTFEGFRSRCSSGCGLACSNAHIPCATPRAMRSLAASERRSGRCSGGREEGLRSREVVVEEEVGFELELLLLLLLLFEWSHSLSVPPSMYLF